MDGPWLALLEKLPLSRTEREVVKRFETDPQGRTFLPIADILRSHRLVDESLELLTQGVDRHPTFTVARVVLARELLQKGLVESAWRALEASPVPLGENILAQKLRFRLAVFLLRNAEARAILRHMQLHQMVDADTKKVADLLEVTGLDAAHARLVEDLRARGTEPVLPAPPPEPPLPVDAATAAAAVASDGQAPDWVRVGPVGGASARDAGPPAATSADSSYLDADAFIKDTGLAGFHVVPLNEIFRPEAEGGPPRAATGAGVELDSTTLADIYATQAHYAKALAVYRRLLRLTPGNDLLRRKVAELARLEREQKNVDLTIDPSVVDRMETVEILDRQIKFYNDLLSRLL